MRLWWLSFVDPELPQGERFLGVVILEATGYVEAIEVAHILGINPGGAVQGSELPPDYAPAAEWRNRLLSAIEIEELERAQ